MSAIGLERVVSPAGCSRRPPSGWTPRPRSRRTRCGSGSSGSTWTLVGVVDEVGPSSPLGLRVADRIATLVSLTLTPLVIRMLFDARLDAD